MDNHHQIMDQKLSNKLKGLCKKIDENRSYRNTSYLINEYHKVVHKYLIGLPPRLIQASHLDYDTRYIWYKYHPNVCGNQTLDICVETHLWDDEEDQLVHPRTPEKVNNRIGFALSGNEYHGTTINLDALHTPVHHRSKGITAPIVLSVLADMKSVGMKWSIVKSDTTAWYNKLGYSLHKQHGRFIDLNTVIDNVGNLLNHNISYFGQVLLLPS